MLTKSDIFSGCMWPTYCCFESLNLLQKSLGIDWNNTKKKFITDGNTYNGPLFKMFFTGKKMVKPKFFSESVCISNRDL